MPSLLGGFRSRRRLNSLVRAATTGEAPACFEAIHTLAARDDWVRGLGAVLRVESEAKEEVRVTALLALRTKDEDERLPLLLEALKYPSKRVRFLAIEALRPRADERAFLPLLERALEDRHEKVRAAARRGLRSMPGSVTVAPLARATVADDPTVRLRAVELLGRIGPDEGPLAEGGDASITQTVLDALLNATADEHSEVRVAAVRGLRERADDHVVACLIAALSDESEDVREVAAEVLARQEDGRAVEALPAALADSQASVRLAAIVGLGKRQDDRVLRILDAVVRATRDPDVRVRREALEIVADQAPGRIEVLTAALEDDAPTVRLAAVEALAASEREQAVRPLIEALRHRDTEVQLAAVSGLARRRDPRAVEPLIELLEENAFHEDRSAHLSRAPGARGVLESLRSRTPAFGDPADALDSSSTAFSRGRVSYAVARALEGWEDARVREESVQHLIRTIKEAHEIAERLRSSFPDARGSSDRAMLSQSPEQDHIREGGSQGLGALADPMRRVQLIIDEMNRLLKEHRFADARAAMKRLPSSVVASARRDIERQIDQAEEGFELQVRVTETVERAQELVNRGDFAAARAVIQDLPSAPKQMEAFKNEVMGNIERIEQASEKAKEENQHLLDRLLRLGIEREQIDQIAARHDFDTSVPLQFHDLLEQLVAQLEA